jgi:uncharacterized protein
MKPALIAARLDEIKRQLVFFVSLRSLEFARRGGRVSLAASTVSRMLNLKPVLGFDSEGKAYRAALAFGSRGVEAKVLDLAQREWSRYKRFRVAVAHAAAPAVARGYRDRVRELTGLVDVPVVEVSAVLAAHAGPGAAGIAILGLD